MLTSLLGLFSCRNSGERIHIRIQNNTSKNINQFWLGSGSGSGGKFSHSYGDIAIGDITGYKSLDSSYASYGNFNFITADNMKYLGSTFPKEDIGRIELDPIYYTFAYTIVGDEAVLRIIKDAYPSD